MSIIKNKQELATTELRAHALEILEAGLEAVDTNKVLKNKIKLEDGVLDIDGQSFSLQSFNKIIFVGIGKCALDGARVMEEILGDRLTKGAVIDVRPATEARDLKKAKYFQGTHPLPSEQNVEATREILEMVKDLTPDNLVICLISGGGSALFELPENGISLDQIIEATKKLTAQGADIYKLNDMRKDFSQVKGGKFAEACSPAKVISLIFSDVLGNDISTIASGPTVAEGTTNILIASNIDALEAMEAKALELGYDATIETDRFSGDAIEFGKALAGREPKPRSCALMGGETTVVLAKPASAPTELLRGEGGRNQTVALAALPHMKSGCVLISASSDGWDNTEHAGALADAGLFDKAKQMDLHPEEFLNRNDSYNFFKKISDGAIYTGRLGSNVADLVIILSE